MAEILDDEIKELEEELKKLEDKDSGYGSPKTSEKDNLFKFYRHILTLKDTTRIGNLSAPEIGISRLSIRGYKHIARYAKAEGLNLVESYFSDQANILSETSMAKKGFWAQLFVTQIKREKKETNKSPEKKKWFSKKEEGGGE